MAELPLIPRPAATLILARDTRNGLEVFLMQRTHQAAFVPGGYVFPGGALDAADAASFFALRAGEFNDPQASRILGLDDGGLAFWVAAIRECFEEAGLLLAYDADGNIADTSRYGAPAELDVLRTRVASGEFAFADMCEHLQLRPAFDQLRYFAHWVTPVGAPRRFDTRFFVAIAPNGQTGSHDNAETIGHAWMRPGDALERQRAGELDMMFATIRTLEELARFDDTASLMAHASTPRTIAVHLPRVSTGPAGRRVLLPADHAYAEVGKLDPNGHGRTLSHIVPGTVTVLSEHLRRVTAPNPGFMTGPGTNSYLVGTREGLAVVDPGPADAAHIEQLLAHADAPIRWILTTHTHIDHSPGAALLKARTGAQVLGLPAPAAGNQEQGFKPDITLEHNQRVAIGGCTLRVIHTPGHASNHLCYLLEEERILLTGDHIMQGSTVVINPPDGDMRAYLASLQQLKQLDVEYFAPGHGFLMDKPHAVIDRIVAHRLAREQKIVDALRRGKAASIEELLPFAYDDVPQQRHAMAARSLLAHLHKLEAEGRAMQSESRWSLL
ncbi:MBL fold metallo-hydrolase [Noviherbaspirillum saxi]|uniref:MBL fold metallo-hydrolase n=1 Tax=Noviherbaspirillum saxi TaxID=2320863 RepID=A0A3A3FIN7_9BURK|nr:MBL fold metallo-hydrolase [Noviherbaspirillum saxi]RJF95353.1 MBL fold metallo-hydrolase [Noviherbaspirillum saxi]